MVMKTEPKDYGASMMYPQAYPTMLLPNPQQPQSLYHLTPNQQKIISTHPYFDYNFTNYVQNKDQLAKQQNQ